MKKITNLLLLVLAIAAITASGWHFLQKNETIPLVYAGSGQDVLGFAWSENYGWVSFNSKNCDANNNGYVDSGVCGGTDTNSSATSSVISYGVALDKATGNLSGYAWSANVGWIYFGPDFGTTTISSAPNIPKNWANFQTSTGRITGWAKVMSLGDRGWLKFGDESLGIWQDKGVKISTTTVANGHFGGWAWNGNDAVGTTTETGIGWLSFNCADTGTCATSNYYVYTDLNSKPTISNLTYSNCKNGSCGPLKAHLGWQFNDPDGGTEGGYQIILSSTNSTSSPMLDTGQCTAINTPTTKCLIALGIDSYAAHDAPLATALDYGHTYYWWVRAWDNLSASSDWSSSSFTTPSHAFPKASFIYSPSEPKSNEEITLTSTSQYAPSGTTYTDCGNDCTYLWSFTGTGAGTVAYVGSNNNISSTTKITYSANGSLTATLTVTDPTPDHFSSATSTSFNIKFAMPKWKEVKK